MAEKKDDQLSDVETAKRMETALKKAFTMPPKPHKKEKSEQTAPVKEKSR